METSLFATSKSKIFAFLLLFILLYTSKETTAQCSVHGSSPSSCSFVASGGSQTVTLFLSGSGCTNYCSNPLSWLTVQNTGQGVFSLTASPNTGVARSGSITFDIYTNTSYTLNVSQASACSIPSTAGPITGTANVVQGQSGVYYSVAPVANATSYIWTLPSGATITAGSNTNSITVDYSAIATSGIITVLGTNSCGSGAVSENFVVMVNLLNSRTLSTNMNYIQARTILKDNVLSESTIETLTADELQETITYFDGLGRPRQNVSWQASPSKKDLVTPIGYDDFGREDTKYLPYTLTGDNNGAFVTGDKDESRWTNNYGSAEDGFAFAKTDFEPSPLNRVLRQGAPGSVWQPNPTPSLDHSVKLAYETNVASEVKRWKVVSDVLTDDGFYAASTLFKTTTWDENNDQTSGTASHTEEFKDLQGKVVLKRSKNGSEILSTYYVYDDFDLLRWVLPPKISAGGGSTSVAGVSISSVSANVSVDATLQLTATVSPSNATNNNVTWSSGNTSVATVDNTGLVTGIAAGSATITVTTQDGGKTASSAINVSIGDGYTIGLNTIGGIAESEGDGYWIANSFTAVSNITVTRMNFYVSNASGKAKLGIYSGSSTEPGTLLAQTGEIQLINGWNSGMLESPQNLTSGVTYWLAIEVNSSATTLYYNSATGRIRYKAYTYGSLPASAPLNCDTSGRIYSIYADSSGGSGSHIGLDTVGSIAKNYNNGFWGTNSFTAVSNITVNRMNLYVSNASGNARLGIYSSSSGEPDALLAQTGEISLTNGWNSGMLGSSLNLTSGVTYWLAIEVNSSATTLYLNSATGVLRYKEYTYGSLPAPAPTGLTSAGGIYSIYADNNSGSIPVTGMSLSPSSATITVDATQQLSATVSPSNATNSNVTWSSGNTSVATVNNSGLVTGVAAGSATITTTTQDGSKTATSAITVNGGDGYTIGLNTLGGISKNNLNGNWIANSFTAVSNITVDRMNLYVTNASGNAILGIYSGSSTEPGTLLAQTGEIQLSNGWNSGTLGSPQNLNSGVTYWLVIEVNSSATTLHNNSSENRVKYTSYEYGSLPSAPPTGLTSHGSIFSVYADNSSGGGVTTNALDELGYQYKYDSRKRMTEKKLPGVGWTSLVYDLRDRLVATQDGVQRDKIPDEWTFTKYDALNRPIMTGIYKVTDGTTQATMQATVNGSGVYSEDRLTTGYGYTNNSFPANITDADILTLTYYDTYDFPGKKDFIPASNISVYDEGTPFEGTNQYYFEKLKEQVTGTKTKVLETNTFLTSTNYYDDRYRVIQTLRDLYSTTATDNEVVSILYDFSGKVMKTQTKQVFLGNTNSVIEKSNYDHAGRLTQVKHQVNNGTDVTLASMEYDEVGQLKQKSLHGEVGSGIQNLNYSYNIRGWLEKINNHDVNPLSNSTQKLNLGLYYNNVPSGLSANAQFNGNISGFVWKTPLKDEALSPDDKQGYGFTYDGLNRMRTSSYGEGTTFATNVGTNNENVDYDKNGNITLLTRYRKGTGLIDNLSYTYKNGNASNMLDKVDDTVAGDYGFSEYVKQVNEYAYDGNGNLIKDDNKGYNRILYNYLNLPIHIGTTDQYISYVYDAAGSKLAKVGTSGALTYYAGSFVYSGSSLKYIIHREGMYVDGDYQYFLKDHLGNTRLVVNTSGEGGTVVQQTDYYPFGMDIATYNGGLDNKYRYNGKEFQDDMINGKRLEWYYYGARFYDPEIGMWHSIDPSAETMRSWSTYAFCFDNPLRFLDFDGRKPGDLFRNIVRAAKDFGYTYNGASISRSLEYGSSIYVVRKNGETYYTYTEPNIGVHDGVTRSSAPDGTKTVAGIHTHGSYEEDYINNEFGSEDKWDAYNKKIIGYLVTTNGSLKMYDIYTTRTTTISSEMPSDPHDPESKNYVAPVTKGSNSFDIFDFLKSHSRIQYQAYSSTYWNPIENLPKDASMMLNYNHGSGSLGNQWQNLTAPPSPGCNHCPY